MGQLKSMNKKLVTFGDSWAYGTELTASQKPFGYWIAESLGYEFENYALEGTSIEHMIIRLQDYIGRNTQPTTAIFFISDPRRSLYWEHDNPLNENWQTYRPAGLARPGHQAYFKYIQSDQLDQHESQVFILALQRICEQYNIKDYYLQGWVEIDWHYFGIDKDKIYPHTATQILDIDFPNVTESQYFIPNKHHPNELGHKKIAQELLQWIS